MKSVRIALFLLGIVLLLAACSTPTAKTPPVQVPEENEVEPASLDRNLASSAFTKGSCGACHVIPGVPGAVGALGPDLTNIREQAEKTLTSSAYKGKARTVTEFLFEAITNPDIYIAEDCAGNPCQAGLMPADLASTLSQDEIDAAVAYMIGLPESALASAEEPEPTAAAPTGVPKPLPALK